MRENPWKKYDEAGMKEVFEYCEGYKKYISDCKTERECVSESIRIAETYGYRNLEDVIDTHWDEVDVQCNYLYYTPLKTDTDLYRYLKKLPELSNYHEKQVELIAVDTSMAAWGCCGE